MKNFKITGLEKVPEKGDVITIQITDSSKPTIEAQLVTKEKKQKNQHKQMAEQNSGQIVAVHPSSLDVNDIVV